MIASMFFENFVISVRKSDQQFHTNYHFILPRLAYAGAKREEIIQPCVAIKNNYLLCQMFSENIKAYLVCDWCEKLHSVMYALNNGYSR